jgi:hypothetical protein
MFKIAAGRHPLSQRVFTSRWRAMRVARMFGFGWLAVYRVRPVHGVARVPSA